MLERNERESMHIREGQSSKEKVGVGGVIKERSSRFQCFISLLWPFAGLGRCALAGLSAPHCLPPNQIFHKASTCPDLREPHGGPNDSGIDSLITGPLARPFACSLAPLTRLLAPHYLLRLRAPLRSLT